MLVTFEANPIVVDGEDLIVAGVQLPFKQKLVYAGCNLVEDISKVVNRNPSNNNAQLPHMQAQSPGNSVEVTIYSMIFHKDDTKPGGYGERIARNNQIKEYATVLRANNTTLVENAGPYAGRVLGQAGDELLTENTQPPLFDSNQQEVQAAGKLYGLDYIKEGQFFDRKAAQEEVIVRDLLTQYITVNKGRCQPGETSNYNFNF